METSSASALLRTDVWDNVKPTGDSLVNLVSQASRDAVTACSLTLVHGQGQSFSEFWWVRYQAAFVFQQLRECWHFGCRFSSG